MATVREGIIKGLKYGAIPAALAMLISESDVVPSDKLSAVGTAGDAIGTLWDKGKVGAAVLGSSAAIGGATEFAKNYMQDKAYGDRVRAAQRAVLAQNNLLTQSTHDGSTKMVYPKNMSALETVANLAYKGGKAVTDVPAFISDTTKALGKSHPNIGGAADVAGAYAGMMIKRPLMQAYGKATEIGRAMGMTNTGTNPANRGFSEEGASYFIGMDPSVTENMTGSLADFMRVITPINGESGDLHVERIQDFLGAFYPVAKTLESEIPSDFSETPLGQIMQRDFGIGSAVIKGLTSGVSGLKKMRMMLPGKKGAAAATSEVFGAAAKNSTKLGNSLADNLRGAFESSSSGVAKIGNKIADGVESAGKTVSAFAKTGAENPDMARSMVKSFQKGSVVAGVTTGAALAKKQSNQGEVAPPQKNM